MSMTVFWYRWIVCGFLLVASSLVVAVDNESASEKRNASEDLYLLSNDVVFSQMSTLLTEAHTDFITKQRGMNTFERQFLVAEQATSALNVEVREKAGPSREALSYDEIKQSFDEEKSYLEHVQNKMDLIRKEKLALDKYAGQIKVMQLAIGALETVFDDLEAYHREIKWRIDDGSLSAGSVPERISEDYVLNLQSEIAGKKNNINAIQIDVNRFIEELANKVADNEQLYETAQYNYALTEKEYNYSLNRRRLEENFLAEPFDEFWSEGIKVQQELTWLDRVFEQSVNAFFRQYNGFIDKRKKVEELLKAPLLNASVPAEAAEDGVAGIQKKLDHKVALIQKYEGLYQEFETIEVNRNKLRLLIEELEADFAIVDEQAFKAKIFLEVMAKREKTERKSIDKNLLERFSIEKIGGLKEKNTQLAIKIASSKKDLSDSHKAMNDRFLGIQADVEQVQAQKKALNAQYIIEKQLQDWNTNIKSMAASDLVATFEKVSADLQQSEQALLAFREKVLAPYQISQDAIKQFARLEYPMFRQARNEMASEKQNIFSSLALAANLDTTHVDVEKIMKGMSLDAPAASTSSTVEEKTEKSPLRQLSNYEGLLSDRRTIFDKRKVSRTELDANLVEVIGYTKDHLSLLEKSDLLAKQRYAVSVELKRRVSLGEEVGAQLPDKRLFRDSLKQDLFEKIASEKQEINSFHTQFSEQSTLLENESTEEISNQIEVYFLSILESVRERLDNLSALTSLEEAYSRQHNELSEIEKTEFNQAVSKKINDDMTTPEWFMALIPSKEADSIHDIVKTYYNEYIELQRKLNAVASQVQTIETMLVVSEKEKETLHGLLADVESKIAQIALEEERHWAIIKAQLLPSQAEHLLALFEKKTGEAIEIPAALTDRTHKIAMIEKATQRIFLTQLQKRALEKWVDVLNNRLSVGGTDYEIQVYQQRLSQLNSRKNGIEREMTHIVGLNNSDIPKESVGEAPETEIDITYLEYGKIGLLKKEISDLRQISVIWLSVKLIAIWFVVLLLLKVFKRLIGQNIKSSEVKNPVLLALLDNFLVGIIWTVAFIATLSVLGFNIGAIMAGLGIGGLALAMASKEALSDIIGGVSLMMAKSFKVGDFVIYEGRMITVQEVGLRYTKFRGGHNDHYLTVVPNSRLSETSIVNVVGKTNSFRVEEDVALSITNSLEKITLAKHLIKEVCDAHPELNLAWVIHMKFDNNAFILRVRFDVDILKLWPARNDLNVGIVEQFQLHGIAFADKPYFQVDKSEMLPLMPPEPIN